METAPAGGAVTVMGMATVMVTAMDTNVTAVTAAIARKRRAIHIHIMEITEMQKKDLRINMAA